MVRLANNALNDARRRARRETHDRRGRKPDPLYRARKLLTMARERLNEDGGIRLRGMLEAGDPRGEVRDAWLAQETLRDVYSIGCAQLGRETLCQLAQDLQHRSQPPELNRLGRTLWRWRTQISNWHAARVANAPAEAANNLARTRQTRRLRILGGLHQWVQRIGHDGR